MKLERIILLTGNRIWQAICLRIRTFYYSRLLKNIGRNCKICKGVMIFDPERVSLGHSVTLNEGAIIQSCDGAEITVGNYVTISYGAKLISGGLEIGAKEIGYKEHISGCIVVEDGVWIGTDSIILAGITVGQRSVVGAGSVVTRDIEPCTVVAGAPAKVVRRILRD